ncbi:hypothetical protein C0J52_15794 [Blattella germanica]|nr:hypothetical protein C0J52_15794 [Blattella germanica]
MHYNMNVSHDGEEEDMEGIVAGRGVFNMDDSSRREGSVSLRIGVFTGVFGLINKSGTGESIGSFEEGSGTVTGSDDPGGSCDDLSDNEFAETCSRLA